eukprot:GHVP01029388.1.p1 GENE.GHVP01029388.1~~GHVP01029388.1.p1  ORF type:complete len:136 (+),score=28.03 GHVP01029388.1:137-544(+)
METPVLFCASPLLNQFMIGKDLHEFESYATVVTLVEDDAANIPQRRKAEEQEVQESAESDADGNGVAVIFEIPRLTEENKYALFMYLFAGLIFAGLLCGCITQCCLRRVCCCGGRTGKVEAGNVEVEKVEAEKVE